ncbi:uncharacterized protein LOC117784099 [Drosophila innubila]|uniref:uncharacterized protein LOC117784099 n=1 Tax=Drosophila innubila TaxID=198719 RepID=UPI00148D27A6|nr:uncharacterized protein LOC117784099 [Drosophila innubila]
MVEYPNNLKLSGLGVAGVNVAYSIVFLGVALQNILSYTTNFLDWFLFGVYVINISVNTTYIGRFLKGDHFAVVLWFSCTFIVYFLRFFLTDYFKWSKGLKILNVLVNIYILVSFIIMAIVYLKLTDPAANITKERNTNWKTLLRSEINTKSVCAKTPEISNFVAPQKSDLNDCSSSNAYEAKNSDMNASTLNCNIVYYMPSVAEFVFIDSDNVQLSNTDKKLCDNTSCHDDNKIGKDRNNYLDDKN